MILDRKVQPALIQLCLAHKVLKAQSAHRVILAHKDQQDLKDWMASKELQVLKAQLVHKELKVKQDHRAYKAFKVQRAQLVQPAHKVLLAQMPALQKPTSSRLWDTHPLIRMC